MLWTSNSKPLTPSSAATTNTTGDRRTTEAFGSFIGGSVALEGRAESPHTRAMVDVGAVCRNPAPAPVVATSDYTFLGEAGEDRLKNPLR